MKLISVQIPIYMKFTLDETNLCLDSHLHKIYIKIRRLFVRHHGV